jgi:dienelactone hydrolase
MGGVVAGLLGCANIPRAGIEPAWTRTTTASLVPPALAGARRIELQTPDERSPHQRPLVGWLFEPDKPREPRAAVLALHGCGGLYNRSGGLSARHQSGVQQLLRQGLVVLMPDSFGPRGYREICSIRYRDRGIDLAERQRDAMASLAYLRNIEGIPPERTAVLGWSHGASTVLALLKADPAREQPGVAGLPSAPGHRDRRAPPFARAVAFYPGCGAARQERLQPAVPVLLLLGGADDWTPARICEEWALRASGSGASVVELEVYAGAHHGFDTPGSNLLRRTDVPHAPDGQGVTTGGHPEARERSWARVRDWLGVLSGN